MTSRERDDVAYAVSFLFVAAVMVGGFGFLWYWLGGQP